RSVQRVFSCENAASASGHSMRVRKIEPCSRRSLCRSRSFAPPELGFLPISYPRLAPWAAFSRCCAAGSGCTVPLFQCLSAYETDSERETAALSFHEHTVAVGVEAVALGYGVAIGVQNVLFSS